MKTLYHAYKHGIKPVIFKNNTMKEKLKELIEDWKAEKVKLEKSNYHYSTNSFIATQWQINTLDQCIREATNLLDKEEWEDGG